MSKDFHAYLECYNHKTHKWEAIQLFKKIAEHLYKEVPLIEGGWGDDAEILTEGTLRSYLGKSYPYIPAFEGMRAVEKETLSPEVAEHYSELFDEEGRVLVFSLFMANLADIKIYTLQHPFITDYDSEDISEDEQPTQRENPLIHLLHAAESYINTNDDVSFYLHNLSDYRLIYWGDY